MSDSIEDLFAPEMEDPAPINWPDRFRKAADVAGDGRVGRDLRLAAGWLEVQPPDVVAAIGRALLGEES